MKMEMKTRDKDMLEDYKPTMKYRIDTVMI